jgi:periplasmic mercuric ion binding protein
MKKLAQKINFRKYWKYFVLGTIMKVILTLTIVGYAQNPKKKIDEVKIKTSAVCGMCKDKIEKNLIFEKGVKDVSLDLKTKIVTVEYRTNKTDPDKIRTAISKLGYDADQVPADPKAYEKLPGCCKKDNDSH